MSQTIIQSIKSAKKQHQCSWCNGSILPGEAYSRYRYFDGGDAGIVKMHPECLEASEELISHEGGPIEFSPGDNPRGCWCGFDSDCPNCRRRVDESFYNLRLSQQRVQDAFEGIRMNGNARRVK